MRNELNVTFRLQNVARCIMLLGLLLPGRSLAWGPPPVITVQPVSQNVPLLGVATFSVTASSGTTMTYQWFKNGGTISGATSSSYTILSILGTSAGNYYVKVSNAGGSVISDNATLNIVAPPAIITQPRSQTVVRGQDVSFSVVASGTGPLSYQWFFNGVSLGSAGTSATLTLINVRPDQAGSYTAVMTNSMGSITSAVATLTVMVPPKIITQPLGQTVVQGQDASFSVVASGTAPLSYQWNFNGSPLAGATTSGLTLTNVQTAQAGSYTVVVTNAVGSVTSVVANLTVTLPRVTLSLNPGAGMSSNGFAFQLSVPAGLTYVIQASTDLRAWTPIATNVATSGTVVFTDTAASNYRQRFYRAELQ